MKAIFAAACLGASMFTLTLMVLSMSGCAPACNACKGACATLADGVTCSFVLPTTCSPVTVGGSPCICYQSKTGLGLPATTRNLACACM